jgi:hypothetical protein
MSVHTTLSVWLFCHPVAQVHVYLLSPLVQVDWPPQTMPSHLSVATQLVAPPLNAAAASSVPAAQEVHVSALLSWK